MDLSQPRPHFEVFFSCPRCVRRGNPARKIKPLPRRLPNLKSPPHRMQLLSSESSSSAQNPALQLRIQLLSSECSSLAQNPAPQPRIQLLGSESSSSAQNLAPQLPQLGIENCRTAWDCSFYSQNTLLAIAFSF